MRKKSIKQIANTYTVISVTDEQNEKTYDVKISDEKYRGRYGKFKTLQEAQQRKKLLVLQDFEDQFVLDKSYKKNKQYIEYLAKYEANKGILEK